MPRKPSGKPEKTREEIVEGIARRRRAQTASSHTRVDAERTEERVVKFAYTAEQRQRIAAELMDQNDKVDQSVDQIEMHVGLTRQILDYRAKHPIPDWLEARFRGLDKPVQQILRFIENPQSEPIRETVPHLFLDLRFLLQMIQASQRKGRGRPKDPVYIHHSELVKWLAGIWAEHRGWPKRRYRDDKGRDWGPFYRFLELCLKPADIEVTDHIIREVIERGSRSR